MTKAVPILRVADAPTSVAWYQRLGFAPQFTHQFEPGFPRFVGVKLDDAELFLSEHTGDAPGPAVVYLWVADVDAVAAEFGAMERIEDMPWARDVELTDPDGNRIRVATAR